MACRRRSSYTPHQLSPRFRDPVFLDNGPWHWGQVPRFSPVRGSSLFSVELDRLSVGADVASVRFAGSVASHPHRPGNRLQKNLIRPMASPPAEGSRKHKARPHGPSRSERRFPLILPWVALRSTLNSYGRARTGLGQALRTTLSWFFALHSDAVAALTTLALGIVGWTVIIRGD
jgi:hypothetical protein